MISTINFENSEINIYLPNELILLIFNFLTLSQCRKIGITCKQLYLIYQYIFNVYLKEQQNFDPGKYIFYDSWFKKYYEINRIINKEDTTKKHRYIEFKNKNDKGKYIRRKIKYNHNKKPYVRNLKINPGYYNRYIFKFNINEVDLIDKSYCDKCFGFKHCNVMIINCKCGISGCDYKVKNDIGEIEKVQRLIIFNNSKKKYHTHNICNKCKLKIENFSYFIEHIYRNVIL